MYDAVFMLKKYIRHFYTYFFVEVEKMMMIDFGKKVWVDYSNTRYGEESNYWKGIVQLCKASYEINPTIIIRN